MNEHHAHTAVVGTEDRSLELLDAWLSDISRQAKMSSLLMLEDVSLTESSTVVGGMSVIL